MHFKQGSNVFKTLIIGAGPAGTGPLVNAQQRGLLPQLLDQGIAIVDRSTQMGSARQARPNQHHRARVVPRFGWVVRLAQTLLQPTYTGHKA